MPKKIIENIKIEKILYKWIGLGKLPSGKSILVKPPVLPGSVVHVLPTKKKKDFILGKAIELLSHDPSRSTATPACEHYHNPTQEKKEKSEDSDEKESYCGGCKRQVISYEQQCELKEKIILDSFRKEKELEKKILPFIKAPSAYHYRNKVECSFGTNKEGQRSLWFHQPWAFDKVVDVNMCHLISAKAHQAFLAIKKHSQESGIKTYNPKEHSGILRHLVIREWQNTSQIMCNLVYAEKNLNTTEEKKQRAKLIEAIKKDMSDKKTVTTFLTTANNSLSDSLPYDSQPQTQRWNGYIFETLETEEIQQKNAKTEKKNNKENEGKGKRQKEEWTITYKISPLSFFQTNTHGANILFQAVSDCITTKQKTILDLYCGTGSIGLFLLKQKKCENIIWIEVIDQAIQDAKLNAKINNMQDQVSFHAWKAEELIYSSKHISTQEKSEITTIIVDPPRNGLHKKTISFLREIKQQQSFNLIYVSCNPTTLARDLALLQENELFSLQSIQGVDMFPQTYHVETIATCS